MNDWIILPILVGICGFGTIITYAIWKVEMQLVAMKKQEFDYWETWKKAKLKEKNKDG